MPVIPVSGVSFPSSILPPGFFPPPFLPIPGALVPATATVTTTTATSVATETQTETVITITPTPAGGINKRSDAGAPNWKLIHSELIESAQLALKRVNRKIWEALEASPKARAKYIKWRLGAVLRPIFPGKASQDEIELQELLPDKTGYREPLSEEEENYSYNLFVSQFQQQQDPEATEAVMGFFFAGLADDLGPEFVDKLVADLEPVSPELEEFASVVAQVNERVELANYAATHIQEPVPLVELVVTVQQGQDEKPIEQNLNLKLVGRAATSTVDEASSTARGFLPGHRVSRPFWFPSASSEGNPTPTQTRTLSPEDEKRLEEFKKKTIWRFRPKNKNKDKESEGEEVEVTSTSSSAEAPPTRTLSPETEKRIEEFKKKVWPFKFKNKERRKRK